MNLKLAEYKDGKFERFLELGRKLGYNGESDNLFSYAGNSISIMDTVCGYCEQEEVVYATIETREFLKDEKDPLNRFNGLFDGRTYGEGRFVLIESKIISRFDNPLVMSQDDIFSYNEYTQKACEFINFHHWEETEEQVEMNPNFKILGNLHENPELWEKVK